MTLVEHCSTDQGSDSTGKTQVVSDLNQFGNEAKVKSFDSLRSFHSFHLGSSHLGCRRNNSTDSDLLVLRVLHSHLGDVMAPSAEVSVLGQREQETASFAVRHAPSASVAVVVEVDSNMRVLPVVAELALPPDGGTWHWETGTVSPEHRWFLLAVAPAHSWSLYGYGFLVIWASEYAVAFSDLLHREVVKFLREQPRRSEACPCP
jgi:hypothetical protein